MSTCCQRRQRSLDLRNTADRSAGELYAGELHDTIKELTAKIVVTSVALPILVQRATLICKEGGQYQRQAR